MHLNLFFFSSSSNLKKQKTLTHTELLWTGSRGEGVFQFDQRASLETRTADGVVSFWRFSFGLDGEREQENQAGGKRRR